MNFGSFLRELRENRNLRQDDFARALNVSTVYICDIEKGRRNPPNAEKLLILEKKLSLSADEKARFYDLAGQDRKEMPQDIVEYITNHPEAKKAIRRIIDGSSEYDWMSIRV